MTPEERCIANLHAIADAIARYKADHNGKLPAYFVAPNPTRLQLVDLALYPRYLKDPGVFRCPACPKDAMRREAGAPFPMTYDYLLTMWFAPSPRRAAGQYKSNGLTVTVPFSPGQKALERVFWREIVPRYEVRVVQCGCHRDPVVLLLDGSVVVRPYEYDPYFARADLFPFVKGRDAMLQRRLGRKPGWGVYPRHTMTNPADADSGRRTREGATP